MNVFVLSTGRCGSTTFARACTRITNYSSAHESQSATNVAPTSIPYQTLEYADNHIEVDNRLSWFLGTLDKTYGKQAFYVHLVRDREQVAHSFLRRWDNHGTNIVRAFAWGPLTYSFNQTKSFSDDRKLDIARQYWETVNDNISRFLIDKPQQITVSLENVQKSFPDFWQMIGAQGDLAGALAEWDNTYNASRPKAFSKSANDSASVARIWNSDDGSEQDWHAKAATDSIRVVDDETDQRVLAARRALSHAVASHSGVELAEYGIPSDSSSWSLDSPTLQFLVALVRYGKPKHIMELGSGISTGLLAKVSNEVVPSSVLSSVDHDPEYVDKTLASLPTTSGRRISLQLAPLVVRQFGESFLPAYQIDRSKLASSAPVDLCIVDGPPTGLGGREGTLYQVLPLCRPGTCVLLDDAARPEESTSLRNWSTALGNSIEIHTFDGFEKGLAAVIVHQSVLPETLWQHKVDIAIDDLAEQIPAGGQVLLIDDYQWPDSVLERSIWTVERDDSFPPATSAELIGALQTRVASGTEFIVFGWPAFWWFDYFQELRSFLDAHARPLISSGRVRAYDFRPLRENADSVNAVASTEESR